MHASVCVRWRGDHKIYFWNGVINKIGKKLVKWKGNYLYFDDRITLIRLVIIALQLFYLSFFKKP